MSRAVSGGWTLLEAAVAFAVVGSLLVIFSLSFRKNWRSSRLVEATEGLQHIEIHALSLQSQGGTLASAPLTPADVPRAPIIDPEGAWNHPSWVALEFRASPEGVPHSYSFTFDVTPLDFSARALGDLDGDGVKSTFEVRGKKGDDGHFQLVPGMRVENELE